MTGLAQRLVSYIGGQPSDMLNQGSHVDSSMYKVGEVIIHDHRPEKRGGQAMEALKRMEAAQNAHDNLPIVPDTYEIESKDDEQCTTVQVYSSAHVDWRIICAKRSAHVRAHERQVESLSTLLRCQYKDVGELTRWKEFVAAEKSVEKFLAVLPELGDHCNFASDYENGCIVEKLFIRQSFVQEYHVDAWNQPRVIAATHTGSMALLDTFDKRTAVVAQFVSWLQFLLIKWHFVVCFTPEEDADGCMGFFAFYYTATTLAVAYDTLCTVRVLMAPVERSESKDASLLDEFIVAVDDASPGQVITYNWNNTDANQSAPVEKGVVKLDLKYQSQTKWQEVMAETLDRMTTYESNLVAPRTRYIVWYQKPVGFPKSQPLHKVDIPLDSEYVDVQVCIQMHNHIGDQVAETRVGESSVTNQFDARHPLCDTTPCGDPQRLPVNVHTYRVNVDDKHLLYKVQPSAIINVEYQLHANAFVTFSYNVVASIAGGYRTMQIFDIRFHAEETVLALNMAEMFIDQENREGISTEYVDSTRTRAILFGNIGRID